MEEFKDIVDFLLQTPPEDGHINDEDVQKALTTLSEILKTFNPQISNTFNECLQRTLHSIHERIHVSDAAVKCSLLVLNFLFSNQYQTLFSQTRLMQILLKYETKDFHDVLQTHLKHIHQMITNCLRCSTDQRNESIDLALKLLLKLAKASSDQQLIRKYLTENELITKLVPLLFIDAKEQRKLVISIIMAVTSTTFSFTTVTTAHIPSLKSGLLDEQLKYVKKIEGLLRLNDEDWHQIWCCVIRLLGLELHKGGPLYVNALLEVLEEAFKSSLNSTRISAFQCWQELILNFAIDIEELCTKKRIKLLLIPLKASNCKAELVALEKFKTWWLLLCKMSPRLFDFIDEALVPFLNFCFSIAPSSHSSANHSHKKEENLYLGRRFPVLLPHLIDALLQIIGHRTQSCKCNPRVVQGNFIDLSRDNLSKISKIVLKSVNQATLLVAKSTELQKTVDCLWYSLLQIIRKDSTAGIREEFINNVIEIIDKLLAKNCVDVAAVIFEETILEKAWLFISLDHEIQYTQNMADKRKLIFSIKKPLVLYNFINVLLEGGGGSDGSSIDMVNNILFNVNFLLTLHETEVYSYFLLLNDVIIRLPRVIKSFLCTPIEYLRRETHTAAVLTKWIELYRQFFCHHDNYPAEITVEFCVYLETIPLTNNIDQLIGNILNICIPKLNVTSVPNICIEKILKILIRLIENEKCLVLNSFNKLLKLFYMNYGAISIIFKSLPNFLKHQQNYDDFFNVLSTIGDIIAKVSTDTFLLTLILTSLKNFETLSADDETNDAARDETKEIKLQVTNLIKKCKLKLKPETKLQNNRSAKMVAMSTTTTNNNTSTETSPIVGPTKNETKLMEKIVTKTIENTLKKPMDPPKTLSVIPAARLMPPTTPSQSQPTPPEIQSKPMESIINGDKKLIESPKVISKPIVEILNKNDTSMSPPPSVPSAIPPGILNMDKLTPILRRLPRILPKTTDQLIKKPNQEFVVINSNWKFNPQNLTEDQKEKMKERGKDIPALYQDLSQSNSQDLFRTTLETDENLKENRTQNLTFKNAIVTENIVAKVQPPPITTAAITAPPAAAEAQKRPRRRTITRVPKPNESTPSTSSSTTETNNQNIAPILENLFSNSQDESMKIKAERELKKLQINCKRSLTVMGTAEKKTLRSRELSAVAPPTPSPGGTGEVKKRGRKASIKTTSPQELNPEESEEVIESSQESSTVSKISKINCSKQNVEEKPETTSPKIDGNIEKNSTIVAEKSPGKQKSESSSDVVAVVATSSTKPQKVEEKPADTTVQQRPDANQVQTVSVNVARVIVEPSGENPPVNNSMVNKLHSIIENNFSEVQRVKNLVDSSDSIPTTAEVVAETVEKTVESNVTISESNVYDKETESITDDFVESAAAGSTANASFVEYKDADNSILTTSMMCSPTSSHSEEDSQRQSTELEKTQEFLNSTLNISPIKVNSSETFDELLTAKASKSPELMFSDEEIVEKVQQPTTSSGSESLIDFNVLQSPSSKRKLHRARGRTAQLLDLLPDTAAGGGDTENGSVAEMVDYETMKSHFNKNNNMLTFEKELPSPLAKPATSIMKGNKRKQQFDLDVASGESDSPKCKRKRVSFHDPPVSCEKQYVPDIQRNSKLRLSARVFKKSQKSLLDLFKGPLYPQPVPETLQSIKQQFQEQQQQQQQQNGPTGVLNMATADEIKNDIRKSLEYDRIDKDFGELSKDDYLIESPAASQGSIESPPILKTLKNASPFFPELVSCTDSINTIFMDLTSPFWQHSLRNAFNERKIQTIGQFSALTELELNRLPLREHKIKNARIALTKYFNSRIINDAEKLNGTPAIKSTEEIPFKRGVKRKRRFSLSLLEKDREEMTLEMKKTQLENIFGNCTDPNELSTLLNTIISIVGTENVLKCTGNDVLKCAGLNKSLEIWMRHAISIVGSDITYEKCVSTLKNITGIDYTADIEDTVQDISITSMSASSPTENEEKLLNTTEKCVQMINTTAETVYEKLTTLIQTAATITTPDAKKKD